MGVNVHDLLLCVSVSVSVSVSVCLSVLKQLLKCHPSCVFSTNKTGSSPSEANAHSKRLSPNNPSPSTTVKIILHSKQGIVIHLWAK